MTAGRTRPASAKDAEARAGVILAVCRGRGLKLATVESCTGGQIAALITSIAGASEVFERGFVTYSNEAKCEMIGVDPALIATQGAVSRGVAEAMADGALLHSRADIAVAVTGVAGPGGGTAAKPVGLVHIACAAKGVAVLHREYRFGALPRDSIQRLSVSAALDLILLQADALA